jgi:site-specific DNA recombinase
VFDKHTQQVLYLGRAKRLASKAQRIVLYARDRGLAFPGCTAPAYHSECDAPVTTVNGGKYFCAGHLTREHRRVDAFVLDVIAARLAQPNLSELLAAPEDDTKPVLEEAKRLRAKLDRLKNDYFAELIDAAEYKEGKERVNAELREIDKKLATRKGGAALGRIAGSPDPAQAFRDASLMAQRAVIDALVTVRLHRQPKGRLKRDAEGHERIDPATVDIQWRR